MEKEALDWIAQDLCDSMNDPWLDCCTFSRREPHSLEVEVSIEAALAHGEVGFVELRVTFPTDYPQSPFSMDVTRIRGARDCEYTCGKLVRGHVFNGAVPGWNPDCSLHDVLAAVVFRMREQPKSIFTSLDGILQKSDLFRGINAVYIAIGCGGPNLWQHIPPRVQNMFHARSRRGGHGLLVLVDPFLTHPPLPNDVWRVEFDRDAQTVVCACNASLEFFDVNPLFDFISKLRDSGVEQDHICLGDHRGGHFGGPAFPLEGFLRCGIDCELRAGTVDIDAIAQLILRVVHGIDSANPKYQMLIRRMAACHENITELEVFKPDSWVHLVAADHGRTTSRYTATACSRLLEEAVLLRQVRSGQTWMQDTDHLEATQAKHARGRAGALPENPEVTELDIQFVREIAERGDSLLGCMSCWKIGVAH